MRVTTGRINSGPHRPRRFVRDEETVPSGSIPVVLEWVGEDAERAERALAYEHAHSARPTLIGTLEGLLETATSEAESGPADDETSEDTDEIAGDPADGQTSDED